MDYPPDREPIDLTDLDELIPAIVPDAEIVGMSKMGDSAGVAIYQLPHSMLCLTMPFRWL
jgi:hypothetical protein